MMSIVPGAAAVAQALDAGSVAAPDAAEGDAFAAMMAALGIAPAAEPGAAQVEPAAKSPKVVIAARVASLLQAASDEATDAPQPDTENGEPDQPAQAPQQATLAPLPTLPPLPTLTPLSAIDSLPPLVTQQLLATTMPAASAVVAPRVALAAATSPAAGVELLAGSAPDVSPAAAIPLSFDAARAAPSPAAPRGPAGRTAEPARAAPPVMIMPAAAAVEPAGKAAPVVDAPAVPTIEPVPASAPAPAIEGSTAAPVLIQLVGAAPAVEARAADAPGPIDAMVEQQLDLAHEGAWLDRLARDIARTAGNEGSLRFRLNPEHLGSLHVEVAQGAAGASIRLTAETDAARAILVDAQPRLLAEARAQGVRIAEAHVDVGGQGERGAGSGGQAWQDQAGAEHRGGRQPQFDLYLTKSKPESSDQASAARRVASDRYA